MDPLEAFRVQVVTGGCGGRAKRGGPVRPRIRGDVPGGPTVVAPWSVRGGVRILVGAAIIVGMPGVGAAQNAATITVSAQIVAVPTAGIRGADPRGHEPDPDPGGGRGAVAVAAQSREVPGWRGGAVVRERWHTKPRGRPESAAGPWVELVLEVPAN